MRRFFTKLLWAYSTVHLPAWCYLAEKLGDFLSVGRLEGLGQQVEQTGGTTFLQSRLVLQLERTQEQRQLSTAKKPQEGWTRVCHRVEACVCCRLPHSEVQKPLWRAASPESQAKWNTASQTLLSCPVCTSSEIISRKSEFIQQQKHSARNLLLFCNSDRSLDTNGCM